jgi:DNA replication and repair protein RecF
LLVNRMEFDGFRNLKTGVFCPAFDINIIYGKNAQGKTNLLEALWLFTGSRSFRGAKDSETVAFDRNRAELKLCFNSGGREQKAEIFIEKRRIAKIGGIPLSSPVKLSGRFRAVVFSPAHLSLIKDGPEERRKFLDSAYCQLRPAYHKILADYQRALVQRNSLLKSIRDGGSSAGIDIWDEKLAFASTQVFAARTAYIRRLNPAVQKIYAGISRGSETLNIKYDSCAGDETTALKTAYQNLLLQLKQKIDTDIAAGFTTVGAHRDDLSVEIKSKPVRIYGSQGQQRSAVLSLKLAEASILKEETGEQPVALLDDVLSELDTSRQDYILNHINGWQVFLTCCDPSPVYRLTGGRVFKIEQGQITQEH